MKKVFLIFLLLRVSPCSANVQFDFLLNPNIKVPAAFVRAESFASRNEKAVSIVYGNSKIGFFEQKNLEVGASNVRIKLIPPTYLFPISFTLKYENQQGEIKSRSLGSRKYNYPFAKPEGFNVTSMGKLSFPFVLVNGISGNANHEIYVPMIVNKLGEIVWAYYRDGEKKHTNRRAVLSTTDHNGNYMFLKRAEETEFLRLRFDGTILTDLDFRARDLPPNSHNFKYLPASNELLYLSYDCRQLPWYKEFLPFFSGPIGWWRLLTLPRRSYEGGRLIRLDLSTLKYREIWNSFQNFSPEKNPSLFSLPHFETDRFQDVTRADQYEEIIKEKSLLSEWVKTCHVDWTHENSLDYKPGKGYLISIRNLNKIILVGEDGRLVWSIGEGPENDYFFGAGGSGFSMQHDARFLENDDILLFDNNTFYRGYTGPRLFNRLMVLRLPAQKGLIEPLESIRIPTFQSLIRGSANILPNGNFFAYSPGNIGMPEMLQEITRTGKFAGGIRIHYVSINHGIQAKPLMAIGDEKLLPSENLNPVPPQAESPEFNPNRVLDY